MATSRFFSSEDTFTHSHIKRVILKKFLQAFIPISYHRTIRFGKKIDGFVIIDGFAGEGKYGGRWPPEIDRYGSPLISLMVTLNLFYKLENNNTDKVWNIGDEFERKEMNDVEYREADIFENIVISHEMASLFFVERRRRRFNRLVQNVNTIFNFFGTEYTVRKMGSRGFILNSKNISCTLINGSFEEFSQSFPDERLHRRACFTFVDPYGFSKTPMHAIEKFLGGEDKTFLVNFMSGFVNRFISTQPCNIAKLYGIELPQTSDSIIDTEFKSAIVYDLKEKIMSIPLGYTSKSNNAQKCAINYQKALERNSDQGLSLMFEMKGKGNVTIYHLVFLTGHQLTYTQMKEAMNICTQFEKERKFSDFDIWRKGYTLNLSNMQDNTNVADVIFERYKGRLITIEEIERFIIYNTPYVFRKKALSIMEKEDNSRITSVEGGIRKRRYTYPKGIHWILTFRT